MRSSGNIVGKGLIVTVVLVLLAIVVWAITSLGAEKGVAILAGIFAIAIGAYSFINYIFGFYASIALSFFVFFIGRYFNDSIPVGYWVDLLITATFLGLILNKAARKEPIEHHFRHIITLSYVCYTIFLLLEVFNPSMHSVSGWFFIVRKYLQFLMIYFIALNIFTTYDRIKYFFKVWLFLSLIAGLYGCYQEWFGFLGFEQTWLWSDSARRGLYVLVTGMQRKFSTFSDPAAYGIAMASTFTLAIVFFLLAKQKRTRMFLLLSSIPIILGVAYSGTRTAYFVVVVGFVLYILMTINNRRSLIFACFFVLGFLFIMFAPIYGNVTINRIRSTFEFSEEASLNVRDENRKRIQPYIYSHPIGGGLATSGEQGVQYNPGHYLAGFPPDSGFVRTAVETGWIGFLFQCLIYLFALQSGVNAYYHARDQRIKMVCIASVICLFTFVIGQYGQVAVGQIPGSFLFYSCLAIITKSKYIDKQLNMQT